VRSRHFAFNRELPSERLSAWPQETHQLAHGASMQAHLFDTRPAFGVELCGA
jgi:hypothetical protein